MTQDQIFTKAATLRGSFLNQVALMEKLIEWYIAYHFCKGETRAYEMIDFLLGDRFVSFESKRGAFELLLKTHKKSIWEQKKDVLAKLTNIQTERNRFAHLAVFTGKEAIDRYNKDGSIAFVKFKEKTEPLWYSPDRMIEIIKDTEIVVDWLKELVNTISPSII